MDRFFAGSLAEAVSHLLDTRGVPKPKLASLEKLIAARRNACDAPPEIRHRMHRRHKEKCPLHQSLLRLLAPLVANLMNSSSTPGWLAARLACPRSRRRRARRAGVAAALPPPHAAALARPVSSPHLAARRRVHRCDGSRRTPHRLAGRLRQARSHAAISHHRPSTWPEFSDSSALIRLPVRNRSPTRPLPDPFLCPRPPSHHSLLQFRPRWPRLPLPASLAALLARRVDPRRLRVAPPPPSAAARRCANACRNCRATRPAPPCACSPATPARPPPRLGATRRGRARRLHRPLRSRATDVMLAHELAHPPRDPLWQLLADPSPPALVAPTRVGRAPPAPPAGGLPPTTPARPCPTAPSSRGISSPSATKPPTARAALGMAGRNSAAASSARGPPRRDWQAPAASASRCKPPSPSLALAPHCQLRREPRPALPRQHRRQSGGRRSKPGSSRREEAQTMRNAGAECGTSQNHVTSSPTAEEGRASSPPCSRN